jgi:sulfur carrier protein ThiS
MNWGGGKKLEVTIRLWGNLSHYLPEYRGRFVVRRSFIKGQTVREFVDEMGLPSGLDILISVNQCVAEGDHVLEEGDDIALFRPMSGG